MKLLLRLWFYLAYFFAPSAALISLIFTLIVLFSPNGSPANHLNEIALVTISPNRMIPFPSDPPNGSADGPTIRMGPLGSCSQPTNNDEAQCTSPSALPVYDLTALPRNATFANPATGSSIMIVLSVTLWGFFTTAYSMHAFHMWLPNAAGPFLQRIERLTFWIGALGWAVGIIGLGVNYAVVQNSVIVFNTQANYIGPPMHADITFGFQLAWSAYGCAVLPLAIIFCNFAYARKKNLIAAAKKKAKDEEPLLEKAREAYADAKMFEAYMNEHGIELPELPE